MPLRYKREDESPRWFSFFFYFWLFTCSQADKQFEHIMLLNTTGFNNETKVYENKVADLCTSPTFKFSQSNINKTAVISYYANWTREHRTEIQANGDELGYMGVHLLGQPNFGCEMITGRCSEMPSCEVIAAHMNLPINEEISQRDADELRRRYFFPKILEEEISFYHTIREAISESKSNVENFLPDIVGRFATQPDVKAMWSCAHDKAVDVGIIFTVASVIAIILAFLPAMLPVAIEVETAAVSTTAGTITTVEVAAPIGEAAAIGGGEAAAIEGGEAVSGEVGMGVIETMDAVSEVGAVEGGEIGAGAVKGGEGTVNVEKGAQTAGNAGKVGDGASKVGKTAEEIKAYNEALAFKNKIWNGLGGTAINAGFIITGFVSQLAFFDPVLANNWQFDTLPTLVDDGRCSQDMGDFGDQNQYLAAHLKGNVNDLMEAIRRQLESDYQKRFASSSFARNNQSILSHELRRYSWRMPLQFRSSLQTVLTKVITEKISRNIISQVLRAAQCYIKCLQLDPRDSPNPWEINLEDFAGNTDSKLALSTFYPEYVLSGMNSHSNYTELKNLNFNPTLQCQFQCLRQNSEGHSMFPDSLRNMLTFQHGRVDPHIMFTEAVVEHLAEVQNFSGIHSLKHMYPTFNLPTCISEKIIINGPPVDDHDPNVRAIPIIYNPKPDYGNTETFFPIQCGDWKASDTPQFIKKMPINQNGTNYKAGKLRNFWYYTLRNNMPILENKPLTYFFTLCAADFRMGHKSRWLAGWGEQHFKPDPEPECEIIKAHTKDMSELEANLYFCNTPVTEDLRSIERDVDHRSTFAWDRKKVPTHQDLCDRMGQQNQSAFGIDQDIFKTLEYDYKAQFETWKKHNIGKLVRWGIMNDAKEYPDVFRWDLEDRAEFIQSTNQSTWPAWPPVLASNFSAVVTERLKNRKHQVAWDLSV